MAEQKLDPGTYFPRLVKMMEDYCRLFHGGRKKERYVPKGLLARYPTQPPDFSRNRPRQLCSDCAHHVTLAATKKILCPFKGEIPCSTCVAPCVTDQHHGNYMRNVMWLRVLILLLTGQWRIVFSHLFQSPPKPREKPEYR